LLAVATYQAREAYMISQHSERLLAYLNRKPILAGYRFSIYKPGLTEAQDNVNRMLCDTQGVSHLCRGICVPFLTAVSAEALTCEKAAIFRCPRSHFIFAIPLSVDSCLVCGGVLSDSSEEKAREMILKIQRLIASFISGENTWPIDSVQPPIGTYNRQHGRQNIRQCRR